jgi:hypothetical protein
MCLAACSSPRPAPAPTETKTVTVASTPQASPPPPPAPPPVPAAGPHSELADVDLPAGTVPACCGTYANNETWLVTTTYDYTVQFLRQRLPILHDLKGMPWCSQEINGKLGLTEWSWADDTNSLQIAVMDRGNISIMRSADFGGRQGLECD